MNLTLIIRYVYAIISLVLSNSIRKTGRATVRLRSEKEIASTDGKTGTEEFAVSKLISVNDEKFIFIVEAKKCSREHAVQQCLLAMKDTKDRNGERKVFGFVTTG